MQTMGYTKNWFSLVKTKAKKEEKGRTWCFIHLKGFSLEFKKILKFLKKDCMFLHIAAYFLFKYRDIVDIQKKIDRREDIYVNAHRWNNLLNKFSMCIAKFPFIYV